MIRLRQGRQHPQEFPEKYLAFAACVVFTFLAVSLATGSIVEALSSALQWRSKTLLAGVQQLVNDSDFTGLAKNLYQHALINPRGPGAADPTKNMPAYIDPHQFAKALMDVVRLNAVPSQPNAPTAGAPLAAALQTTVNTAIPPTGNLQMNTLLQGIIQRSAGDLDKISQELADWFDNAMDRVGGGYKRWTQLVNFLIAVVLCVALNIDTARIATTLWAQPALVQSAKIAATPSAADALQTIEGSFPIGWPNGQWFHQRANGVAADRMGPSDWAQSILGWLITALATLFGAPFWFDTLQSVIRLKGTGPSPDEKQTGRAAAA